MTDNVNALVSIPDTLTAFKASADEGRVTFAFPKTQLGEFYKLAMMRDKVLRITVAIENSDSDRFG
jgi:hypothetical protein